MKKVLLMVAIVASLFITEKVQAQYFVAYSPETFKLNGSGTDYIGVSAGFFKNRRVKRIDFESDVYLTLGGQIRLNTRNDQIGDTIKIKDTQILLDIPLLVKYMYRLQGSEIRVAGFAGPMVSVGVLGKTNTKTFVGKTEKTSTDSEWYGDNSNISRLNLYLVLGGEVRYRSFTVFAGYRIGLRDLDKRDDVRLRASGGFVGLAIGV